MTPGLRREAAVVRQQLDELGPRAFASGRAGGHFPTVTPWRVRIDLRWAGAEAGGYSGPGGGLCAATGGLAWVEVALRPRALPFTPVRLRRGDGDTGLGAGGSRRAAAPLARQRVRLGEWDF